MKRIFLTTVACSALVLTAAGSAAAHGSHHHTRGLSSHKRHHRHAHLVRFGTLASSVPSGTTTTPTPTPTSATPSDEPAGTVASFTNGVLTIKLTDGSMVSGKVNENTQIECPSVAPTATMADDHGASQSGDGSGDHGSGDGSGPSGEQGGRDDGSDGGNDDGNDEAAQCTSAALVSGAVVHEAELSVGSAGAVWEKVELG